MSTNYEQPSLLIFSSCSFTGERGNNEDNFYCDGIYPKCSGFSGAKGLSTIEASTVAAGMHLFAVCDGMGGEALGDVAASIATDYVDSLHGRLKLNPTVDGYASLMESFYDSLNAYVIKTAAERKVSRIGTTIAVAAVINNELYCSNVGDSKIFLYRDHRALMLTNDDNAAYALYQNGEISERELDTHPDKARLIQYIGKNDAPIQPHISKGVPLQKGDVILLCSDGVTDGVSGKRLEDAIEKALKTDSVASTIVDKAYEGGSKDNITAIVVQYK